jgi:hypothetical protein
MGMSQKSILTVISAKEGIHNLLIVNGFRIKLGVTKAQFLDF